MEPVRPPLRSRRRSEASIGNASVVEPSSAGIAAVAEPSAAGIAVGFDSDLPLGEPCIRDRPLLPRCSGCPSSRDTIVVIVFPLLSIVVVVVKFQFHQRNHACASQ